MAGTGLRKQQPQKRRIQRPSGTQDLTVGAAPKFGRRTVIQGIINVQSISSHSYIKEASEGYGLAIWKQADKKYALAIDKIYLREGGNLQTIATDQLPSSSDYVNIKQNEILISRVDTTGSGAALTIQAPGSNSNGMGIATTASGAGDGLIINVPGSGDCLVLTQSGTGKAAVITGLVQLAGEVQISGANARLYIQERASAAADYDGFGQLWVKDTTPSELWFTKDDGTDIQIS